MLSEFEREQLAVPCVTWWIKKLSASDCTAIVGETSKVFRKWREKERRKPTYKSPVPFGGLLALPGNEGMEPDDIEIAFHLWLSKDRDFAALLERRGRNLIFASVLATEWRTAREWSVLRACAMLTRELVFALEMAHSVGRRLFDDAKKRREHEKAEAEAKNEAMKALTRLSAEQRAINSNKRKDKLIKEARGAFLRRPDDSVRDVAKWLKDIGADRYDEVEDEKGLTIATICKMIAGTKARAAKERREGYMKFPSATV